MVDKKTNMSKSTFNHLPNFELSPLCKIDRNFLVTDNEHLKKMHGFILALGLIFNDLKGILWLAELLKDGKPPTDEMSSYFGQWGGMNIQVWRYATGITNELLELIERNNDCLEHPKFKLCLKHLKKNIRKSWSEIVVRTNRAKGKSKFRLFLYCIRSETAFHYYNTEHLEDGYEQWLKRNDKYAEFACFSFGHNMDSTRFYLSDAVSQVHFQNRLDKYQITTDEIIQFLNKINETIRFIIEKYIIKVLGCHKNMEQI